MTVRFEFHLFDKHGCSVPVNADQRTALIVVGTRIERNAVFHALFKINSVECLVLHSPACCGCSKAHIMRIFRKERAVGLDFERRRVNARKRFPRITPVDSGSIVAWFSVGVLCLEIGIFEHLGV